MSELLEDVDDLEDDPGVSPGVVILVRAETRGVEKDHWATGVTPPQPFPDIKAS